MGLGSFSLGMKERNEPGSESKVENWNSKPSKTQ